jgi:hypothetical protein
MSVSPNLDSTPMAGKKSRYAGVSDSDFVDLAYGNPLGADGVSAPVEMNRRFKDAAIPWSVLLFLATLTYLVQQQQSSISLSNW